MQIEEKPDQLRAEWLAVVGKHRPARVENFYGVIYDTPDFIEPTDNKYLNIVFGTAKTKMQYPFLLDFAAAALYEFIESYGAANEFDALAASATPENISPEQFARLVRSATSLLRSELPESLPGTFVSAVKLFASEHLLAAVGATPDTFIAFFLENPPTSVRAA